MTQLILTIIWAMILGHELTSDRKSIFWIVVSTIFVVHGFVVISNLI